jgi:heptosyltransferase-2
MRKLVCFFGKLYFELVRRRKVLDDVRKIAVIKTGAIGDVLMSTPFLRVLRKRFPKARIVYYVGAWAKDTLAGNKNLDEVVEFDQSMFFRNKIFAMLKLIRKIKKEKYDLCFNLDKHYLLNVFAYLCKIHVRVGFDRYGEGFANTLNVRYGPVKHEVDYYLELAYKVGAKKTENKNLEMFLSKKDTGFADEFFRKNKIKKAVAVAPGGAKNPGEPVHFVRRWPQERFLELVEKIKSPVILLGGPGDVDAAEFIIKNAKRKNVYSLVGKTSLKEAAAVMKKCSCIVCCDSGLMHVASAVNKKIISIFGPTNPARKAPLHKESIAIWKDQAIYEEDYEIYGTSRMPKKEFFRKISVEDVLRDIK